ncbi:zinc finger, CCHC-type containing protein [Tanacetum coccineum]
MLFLKGKQLNENLILNNFELPIESTLYLLPNPRAKVQVLVKMMSGKTRVMKVRSTKTVSELIGKIHRKEGVPAEKKHKLMFNQKELDRESKFLEYNLIWCSLTTRMTTSSANNSVFRGFFEKQKLTGPNFIDWYRQLRIVLSIEDKLNYLEQPLPPAPVAPEGQQVAPEIIAAHMPWD